jgi:hypothetical protein
MQTFSSQQPVSSVTRITGYTSGISQSTTVTSITSCYLRPLSEVESSNNGFQFGTVFNAIFEVGTDIREQDKITIAGTTYTVKGVANHNRGFNTGYVKALIIKPQQ